MTRRTQGQLRTLAKALKKSQRELDAARRCRVPLAAPIAFIAALRY